jgi:hypothetical protein
MDKKVKPKNTFDFKTLLENPINRFIAICTIIVTLFSAGYKTGDLKNEFDHKLEMLKKQQECNESVQNEKEKCLEYKRNLENQRMDNLAKTIEELAKIQSAKK